MTAAGKRRLTLVVAIVLAGVGLSVVAFGNLGSSLVYYWSPSELLKQGDNAYGPTIRLGGVVRAGSIKWKAEESVLEFDCATGHDLASEFVHVNSVGVPPQMFRDGIGVVVEGTYSDAKVFNANRLMVNHSNEYQKVHPQGPPPGQEVATAATTTLAPSTPASTTTATVTP